MSALKELKEEKEKLFLLLFSTFHLKKKKTNFLPCPIYSLNRSIHDLLLPHSLSDWINFLHLQSSVHDLWPRFIFAMSSNYCSF